jgi:hypothetical protein
MGWVMQHHRSQWVGVLGTVCLLGCGATDAAEVADSTTAPFSTAPGEPNHEAVTQAALSFLRSEILTLLTAANVATDVEFFLVNANHFDDCNFSGGSAVVSSSQAEAVGYLDPGSLLPDGDALALRAFGRSLHAVQDFYAHSNWIELGGQVLVDDSLGAFPSLEPYAVIPSSGFVVVQGPKPKRAALSRDEDAAYPESAIVTYRLKGVPSPGLISGTVDYEEGDFCPASVAMTHDELNKDKSSLTDRVAQFEAAKTLAIAQTRHEWCRLNQLARDAYGDAGPARLALWVGDPAGAPDCSAE